MNQAQGEDGGSRAADGALPPSKRTGLEEFLSTEGNTLLIKGDAGSGKTTLALQLLKTLAPDGHGVYISARVSREKLGKHMPSSAHDLGRPGTSGFVDMRLGNGQFVISELIKVIKSRGKDRARAIVLDTWDAFAKEMEPTERIKAEKTLMALADTSDARIIFVSEEPDRTTMEYLVDGIVILRRVEEGGVLLREYELAKLRGTPIDQHKRLFSLDGGTFSSFEYHVKPDYTKAHMVPPKKDLDDAFSFGSVKLDQLFYGIPKGSTFAIEYETNVHYSSLRLIDFLAVINALNLGHGVFLLPLPASPLQEVRDLIKPFVNPDAFVNNFAIGSMAKADEKLKPPFFGIGADDEGKLAENIAVLIEKVRRSSKTKQVLSVESMVQLESAFASTSNVVLEKLSARISKIQEASDDALVVTLHSDAVMKSRILAMSRRYARIFMRYRVPIIVGEKPSTEPYVLERNEENSLLPKLTKIV